MSRWFGKTAPPMIVAPLDDSSLRAAQEDTDRVARETRLIRDRIHGQWGEVWERFTYSQQRLEENDIAGALERGAGLGGGRHA